MEFLQHKLLPFGNFLALGILLWAGWSVIQKRANWPLLGWAFSAGALGGATTVIAFVVTYRLPWLFACLDCFASKPWYSYTLTAIQGFGFFSVLALAVHRLYIRRHASAA